MRLNAVALSFLALATTIVADEMTVLTYCHWTGTFCSSAWGLWRSAYGSYWIDANEGCRDPDPPGMNTICMDWGNSRAHFYFDGQGKRCLTKWSDLGIGSCDSGDYNGSGSCSIQKWKEVACTW